MSPTSRAAAPASAGAAPSEPTLTVYAGKPTSAIPNFGAASPGLELTVHVLDVAQVSLISLDSVERAARRINGRLNFTTCSDTNTATVRLAFPERPDIVLMARRERGYPVLRGTLAPDGRLVLSAEGTMILILDTGAQANVIGPSPRTCSSICAPPRPT